MPVVEDFDILRGDPAVPRSQRFHDRFFPGKSGCQLRHAPAAVRNLTFRVQSFKEPIPPRLDGPPHAGDLDDVHSVYEHGALRSGRVRRAFGIVEAVHRRADALRQDHADRLDHSGADFGHNGFLFGGEVSQNEVR